VVSLTLQRFKRRQNMMWRTTGVGQILQLIVIAPLAYRLRKGSKLLYRHPAFLICTDPALEPRQIIEAYFQRWDIEVNFRDEKTLLGVCQAQVRNTVSVESAPAFAAYGMLPGSGQLAFGNSDDGLLPQPKWAASFQRPTHLNTTTHSSTPRRSLGPRLLRQWLKFKRPKPAAPGLIPALVHGDERRQAST
jgi:hypothetical protein